jgi:hypothetical protein
VGATQLPELQTPVPVHIWFAQQGCPTAPQAPASGVMGTSHTPRWQVKVRKQLWLGQQGWSWAPQLTPLSGWGCPASSTGEPASSITTPASGLGMQAPARQSCCGKQTRQTPPMPPQA